MPKVIKPMMSLGASKVGIGTWQLGGEHYVNGRPNSYGPIKEDEIQEAIKYAFERGINFFDTASGYGDGRSEKLLGEALRDFYRVERPPIITTKYSLMGDDSVLWSEGWEKKLEGEINKTLKRLKRDYVDVVLLHNPPDELDYNSIDLRPIERLLDTGKILAYGASVKSLKGAKNVVTSEFGDVLESIYNVLDRRMEDVFELEAFTKYYFIARSPLASGFLTRKRLKGLHEFKSSDIRSTYPLEVTQWLSESVKELSFLDDMEGGISISSIRFCAGSKKVDVVIPGIKSMRHAEDAVRAMQLGELPQEVKERIRNSVPTTYSGWMIG